MKGPRTIFGAVVSGTVDDVKQCLEKGASPNAIGVLETMMAGSGAMREARTVRQVLCNAISSLCPDTVSAVLRAAPWSARLGEGNFTLDGEIRPWLDRISPVQMLSSDQMKEVVSLADRTEDAVESFDTIRTMVLKASATAPALSPAHEAGMEA